MRIAVLHPYMTHRGGAIRMMLHGAQALTNMGHTVDMYVFARTPDCYGELVSDINIHAAQTHRLFRYFMLFSIAWKIRKVDTIICGNAPMHWAAVIARILFGSRAKVFWWHHHVPWLSEGEVHKGLQKIFFPVKRLLEHKIAIPRIDTMIATSKYVAEKVYQYCGRKSHVVYPIIDRQFFQDDKPSRDHLATFRIPPKSQVMMTYGRLEKGKNIEFLIKTYKKLKKKHPNLVFLIGGEGSQREALQSRAYDVEGVFFLGALKIPDIIWLLRKSDVFVFASLIDAFGMSIIEAQTQGIPVVCLDRGGVGEAMDSYKNGHLVKNKEDFFRVLRTVFTNLHKKNTQKISMQKDLKKHYDFERLYRDFAHIIGKN